MSSHQLHSTVTCSIARLELNITRPDPVNLEDLPGLYTFTDSNLEEISNVPLDHKGHQEQEEGTDGREGARKDWERGHQHGR